MTIALSYDIVKLSKGNGILVYVILDAILLGMIMIVTALRQFFGKLTKPVSAGLEIYFMTVVRAFQKHLEIINEPEIVYHPVNEIDDEAYINDYY